MPNAVSLVPGKFKLFIGEIGSRTELALLIREVEDFVRKNPCAPKSFAVEYIETSKRLLFSLGYRDDEPPFGITLSTIPLGRVGDLEAEDIARLETRLAEAAAAVKNLIGHEIFVSQGECTMVLMAPSAG